MGEVKYLLDVITHESLPFSTIKETLPELEELKKKTSSTESRFILGF